MSKNPKEARRRTNPLDIPLSEDAFSSEALEQVPLLTGVSKSDLEIARRVVKRHMLSPGELLVAEDARGDTLFFLMEGTAKITVRKGKVTVLLGLCGKGELLGELAAIDGQTRSATVTTQTTCIVGALRAKDFWKYIWPLKPVPVNLAYLLVERVRRLTSKVQAMATLDVRRRLAFQLVLMARDLGTIKSGSYELPFGLTQVELSQMVGASRVQINQTMKDWKEAGIISTTRSTISVHDINTLREIYPASLESVVRLRPEAQPSPLEIAVAGVSEEKSPAPSSPVPIELISESKATTDFVG